MNILTEIAKEKSTYIVTCAFKDENGDDAVPSSIKWSLTDNDGTVINSRDQVTVAVPAASIDIVLYGDDLAILSSETIDYVNRKVIIEAVYDSDAGSNLPFKDGIRFALENLTKIT